MLTFNNKLGNQGELWRVCLAGKDKFLAERIYKLEVPWKFEDDWTKLADICKMLLLIEVRLLVIYTPMFTEFC